MKVFVSHSMKDQDILKGIDAKIEAHGIQLLVAEHIIDIENSITDKIISLLDACDIGIFLLTKNGMNSNFVHQELGYLVKANKPCLLIIEKGQEKKLSGFKYGYDFITLDMDAPQETYNKMEELLLKYYKEKRVRERNDLIISLGIIAGLLILATNGDHQLEAE